MKCIYLCLMASSVFMQCAYSSKTELPTADFSQIAKPATIKVLISQDKKNALLEAKGRYRVYNPLTELMVFSGASTKRADILYRDEGLFWGEEFTDITSIRIVPLDVYSSILIDGIEYRGCVEVHVQDGKLCFVNEIDIERYLKSSLNTQFPEEMDHEVMEALAIVARTHAYYLMSHDPKASWHVNAREIGYEGNALTLQNIRLQQAIDSTRNMIMTYKGSAFPAVWTQNSAGRTADFAAIFRKDVSTPHGVATPLAAKERPGHRWVCEISKSELARRLKTPKLSEIDIYQDKDSQKIYALRAKGGDEVRTLDFFALQKVMGGSSTLKSNDFTISIKADTIQFTGYGEGHGVGLCLFSAAMLADKGKKAMQILGHFFPESRLEHIALN